MQAGGAKRVYQVGNQDLIKISFRVESSVWLEFGQMSAYLGVSRCLLFVYLLEIAKENARRDAVGTPTHGIAGYDLEHPARIEYYEYVRPGKFIVERGIRQIPSQYKELPFYLRYEAENPLRI